MFFYIKYLKQFHSCSKIEEKKLVNLEINGVGVMSQRDKFVRLSGPAFLAIIILLMLDNYRQYAIVPVLLFWIAFFTWDAIEKKEKGKRRKEVRIG